MKGEIAIREFRGTKPAQHIRLKDGKATSQSLTTASGTISASLSAALLPEGYPDSVTSDYSGSF